ncbi:MAG: hypothetical protein MH204_11530 [Fimbriimonadaceae bacterium]|nr:hypothetical protein [Fimbriimonadaceae bacterium]
MMSALMLALVGVQASPAAPGSGWRSMPLVSRELRAAGFAGGEGGQWPRALAADSQGRFLLLGVDVGGIYRSRDGGRRWEPANVGFMGRGAAGLSIDPKNPQRAVAVATNTAAFPRNGVYLTEDGASSWRLVLPADISGNEFRDQIIHDPSSWDAVRKETRTLYWSRVAEDRPDFGTAVSSPGLYVSRDAGRAWSRVPNSERWGGSILKPGPRGLIWIGNGDGLHLFDPRKNEARRVREGRVTGVAVVPGRPNSVWLSRDRTVERSDNLGASWLDATPAGLLLPAHRLRNVTVSPADPNRLMVWAETEPNDWNWPRMVSHDAGRTWRVVEKISTGAFLPDNTRQGISVWHPQDRSIAWGLGGDWPTRSEDGGRSFAYSGTGYSCFLVGGAFAFSRSNPDVVFFASQDYNGAMTEDRGRTWRYLNVSGEAWGGFTYGGYALNDRVLFAGNAPGWGGPREVKVSRDGGRTWEASGLQNRGLDAGFGWSRDLRVGFIGDLRTEDEARSWQRMADCDGVLTDGPDGELFGIKRGTPNRAVRSDDGGRTWTTVFTTEAELRDLAWDPKGRRLYAAAGLQAWVWDGARLTRLQIPLDATGESRVRTVAVDPSDPKVVYVGSAGHVWSHGAPTVRSLDSGKTWQVLTETRPLAAGRLDGGREVDTLRVHPRTRELWAATSCFGQWVHPGPNG